MAPGPLVQPSRLSQTSREAAVRVKSKAKLCEPWEPRTYYRMSREAAAETQGSRSLALGLTLSPLRGSLMKGRE